MQNLRWVPHDEHVWLPCKITDSGGGYTTYETLDGVSMELSDKKTGTLEVVADSSLTGIPNLVYVAMLLLLLLLLLLPSNAAYSLL
jgi:hypothetical protein